MLTDEKVDEYFEKIRERIDSVNSRHIKEIGAQIQQIGKLNRASIRKLEQMQKFGASSEKMKRELARALKQSQPIVQELLEDAVRDEYHAAEFAAFVIGNDITDPKKNKPLQRYLEAVAKQTEETFQNWSNSTVIDQNYQEIISDAVDSVSRGVTDYGSAIRRSIKKYGGNGLSVEYESGAHRRLDTAIRQNILDGTRQVSQQCAKMIGEEIGADGVELSAHPYSALDHEECQGRQYTNENYEKMQSDQPFEDVDGKSYQAFKRPITQWNCRHFASPILIGISPRRYTDAQLAEWKRQNHKGIDLDGKHYTIYQASQYMRNLETEVRQQKEKAMLCEASGDDVGRRDAQWEITKAKAKYKQISELSGLKQRPEKMLVNGYKNDGQGFTLSERGSIISEKGITHKRYPKDSAYTIDREYVNSNAYKKKFDGITGKTVVDESLHRYAKAALYHRDGTVYEDLYIISDKTGEILGKNLASTENFGVAKNQSIISAYRNHKGELIGLHNHPDGTPPTGSDFEAAFERGYSFGVVANATGDVYIYRVTGKRFSGRIIDSTIRKYQELIGDDGKKVFRDNNEAHIAALNDLIAGTDGEKGYDIWYEKRLYVL